MNEYYYNTFIEPMLMKKPILNKKKMKFLNSRYHLNLHILLHMGSPCDMRYCICKFIPFEDISEAFV